MTSDSIHLDVLPTTSSIFLITISGQDHPGITTQLTDILSLFNINILDIGQSVIHDNLSMGFLVEIPIKSEFEPVFKEVLFKAHQLGVSSKFQPISIDEYSNWVNQRGQNRYILTLMSRKITSLHISKVTKVIYENKLNIDTIKRLSGRVPVDNSDNNNPACVELSIKGMPVDQSSMKRKFLELSQTLGIDIAFQEDSLFRRSRRLVCFDMDSTLIQTEVIVELAKEANVEKEVYEITEAAMRGEIDFSESFIQRVKLLKGIDISVMETIAKKLPLTEGTEKLVKTLKFFGYKTAILSGGFTYFGEYLKNKLDMDYVFANELEVENGKLTGKHKGVIVDGIKKAQYLKEIAQKENIHLQQVIAVGDGANDLPMLSVAGLGIAFQAKPIVREKAQNSISTLGIDTLLYILGYRDIEIQ